MNFMANSYQPINCSFYDELEALATLRKKVVIKFLSENEENQSIEAVIINFIIKDKTEYMLLDNGHHIRLDAILEVDGKKLAGYC